MIVRGTGLAASAVSPYLNPTMSVLRFFSPVRAYRDLRTYVTQREQPHRLLFLVISVGITSLLIAGFVKDSFFERAYKRDVQYVEDWRLDRTDEEIIARQAVMKAERDKILAELKARQEKRQAEFKRLDDKLNSWGI